MSSDGYYFRTTEGEKLGPVTLEVVAKMIQDNKVRASTPISIDGQIFKPMKSFPEFASLLAIDAMAEISTEEDEQDDGTPTYTGDMTQVSFPKLLYHFTAAKNTGRLVLNRSNATKELFLVNGKPVASTSNLHREKLGQVLVNHGVLSHDELLAFLHQVAGKDERIGEVLLQSGTLQPHELVHYLNLQLQEKIYEIFKWRTGRYSFYQGQKYLGALMAVNLNPWEVITEGVRRGYKLRELRQLLDPYLNRVLVPINNQHVHLNNLNLQTRELKVFKSATGLRTIGVLLDKLGQDDKEIHTVLSMIYLGLELELLSLGEEKADVEEVPELVGEVEGYDPLDQEMAEAADKPSFYHGRPVDGPFQATPRTSQEEQELLETLNRLKEMDYFQVLGLERTASSAEVTKAFVKAARSYHPDSVPTDVSDRIRDLYSQIFSVYNDAQQKLSNDEKRQQYLEALESGRTDEEVDISNIMEAETVFQKGEMLLKSRKYQQALDEFEKAIQLNPDEGEFYIYQGYSKFMTNPKAEATYRNQCMSLINKGLQMRDNRVSNGFLFLGRIHNAAGNEGQARTMFEKAISLEPNNVEASRELRLINMRTDKKGHRKKKR